MNKYFRVTQDLGAADCVLKTFYDYANNGQTPSYISMGNNNVLSTSCALNDFSLRSQGSEGNLNLIWSQSQNIYEFSTEKFIYSIYEKNQIKDGQIFTFAQNGSNQYYGGWDVWKQEFNISWYYNQFYSNLLYRTIGNTNYKEFILDQSDGISRGIIRSNMIDVSTYNYIYDNNPSFTLASASQGNFSCGVNSDYFPYFSAYGGTSLFGHYYLEGSSYQGLVFLTNYNYGKFKIGMSPNQDNMLQFGTNGGQNYTAIKCDNDETALWMFDRWGNNLLWNSQHKGIFNLYTYLGNLAYFGVPSEGTRAGEASMWFRDFLNTNLIWNSVTDGKLQMYSNKAYSSFYIKDEASFWFYDYANDHNIKYNSYCNLLQIWDGGNGLYINISTEDLKYSSGFAKFRYIKKNGKNLLDANGKPIMILATSDIDISQNQGGTAFLS